jgi:ATP-dependent DNA ligase
LRKSREEAADRCLVDPGHDGYRLIVSRRDGCVRLFTRTIAAHSSMRSIC